ncbi:MAG: alpha/beta hydrolase [Candidatus Thiodiazotropha sp. (ex Myrtea sp. 'scaly one' KF741663)]|nr:alpha/beta hydrolase [Candidatus Thiodiazotropha sp. (ex Myrtea sp. 'scaly one' KF741663)]
MRLLKSMMILLVCSCLVTACTTLRHSQRMEIDNGQIAYATLGEGPLTIVLEAGLGDGMGSWDGIFEELSSITKVFAYSRPGYLPSSATKKPRTPEQIVDDLRLLLMRSGTHPPYLLVGHSLGGLYMLNFIERYPDEVAGAVLIDSRHPMMTQACHEQDLSNCSLPTVLYALLPSHVRREYDDAQQSWMPATIGDTPLVVVSRASDEGMESDALQALWMEMQTGLSELSGRSQHLIAEHAGHYVHKQEPERVIEGINWVISEWHSGQAKAKADISVLSNKD